MIGLYRSIELRDKIDSLYLFTFELMNKKYTVSTQKVASLYFGNIYLKT